MDDARASLTILPKQTWYFCDISVIFLLAVPRKFVEICQFTFVRLFFPRRLNVTFHHTAQYISTITSYSV